MVYAHKVVDGGKANTLVAVHERVVDGEALEQSGRFGDDVFVVTGLRPEQGGFQRAWIANAGRTTVAPDQDGVHAEDVGHSWKVAIGHLASSR